MKKIYLILILFSLVFSYGNSWAQENEDNDRWERYRAEKVAFLTNKLDLTPQEAEKFWPVYNELEKERGEVQTERRKLERDVQEATENLSDQEIVKLTRDYANNQVKECDLGTKYNEKFLKILPPQKVLRLYKAESEFRMHMIRQFRERRRDDNN